MHFNRMIPLGDEMVAYSDLDDAALVRAVRASDMDALAELYRRYSGVSMAVAYRLLQSKDAAEDVVHDVFVGLPEAVRKYDERGKFAAWIKQVSARVALSVLRRDETTGRLMQTISPPVQSDVHTRMTLDDAVAALAPTLRAVLVLKEIEGFSHAEIASMLGISKGASEVRLHRAFAQLRAMIVKGESSS
jgi:RNA polymerase sigma factor (sigma-70 family)